MGCPGRWGRNIYLLTFALRALDMRGRTGGHGPRETRGSERARQRFHNEKRIKRYALELTHNSLTVTAAGRPPSCAEGVRARTSQESAMVRFDAGADPFDVAPNPFDVAPYDAHQQGAGSPTHAFSGPEFKFRASGSSSARTSSGASGAHTAGPMGTFSVRMPSARPAASAASRFSTNSESRFSPQRGFFASPATSGGTGPCVCDWTGAE